MKYCFVAFLSFLIPFSFSSQAQAQAIGHWQSYLTHIDGIAAVEGELDIVYLASDWGILERHPQGETYAINKLVGLSDMGISTIAYNKPYHALIVAYRNGNLDIYYFDTKAVVNLPAIYQNTSVLTEKRVRNISCDSNLVYLSCAFGMVTLDMDILEFAQTTFTNSVVVNAATRYQNALWLATNKGLYKGELDGRNLQDFNVWEKQTTIDNLPSNNFDSKDIINFQNTLYAIVADTLMSYNPNTQLWQHIPCTKIYDNNNAQPYCVADSFPIINLSTSADNNRLLLSTGRYAFYTYYPATGNLDRDARFGLYSIKDVCRLNTGQCWVADAGGYYIAEDSYTQYIHIGYEEPYRPRFTKMITTKDGALWAAGSPLDYTTYFFDGTGFYEYKDGHWNNYNYTTRNLSEFRDVVSIAYSPKKQEVFVGSFMDGLLKIDKEGAYTFYNNHTGNSAEGLQSVATDTGAYRVTGLAVDDDNNLWISCHLASNPIVVRKADGTWKRFPAMSDKGLADIAIDRNGYKWIRQERGGNLLVFSEEDMDDDTDDKYIVLTTSNSNLASDKVNCVVADREGVVWVGTNDGVTIFPCGQSVFDGQCTGTRPVVNPDNFNAHLLEGENILTIAVDGANRKWIGTNNGVFLLSDDGYEKIAYFNVENSQLFDNTVNQIAIDGKTGLVYMSTGRGLQSYRSDATTAKTIIDKKQAYAFPNPVKPDYEGTIAITNLPEDANVKITDISGRLVYETYALGGQAVWNGNDYNGKRASSGVYLVYVVNPQDASQKLATKIAFLH